MVLSSEEIELNLETPNLGDTNLLVYLTLTVFLKKSRDKVRLGVSVYLLINLIYNFRAGNLLLTFFLLQTTNYLNK